MKKQVISAFLMLLLGASLISGCGKRNEPSNSSFTEAKEDIASHNSSESDYINTSTADTMLEDLIGLTINGTALTFPFQIDELGESLVLTPKLYSEDDDYTLCILSDTNNNDICSVFVEGKSPEQNDSKIIGIIVDDMNDEISFRGLNCDTATSYIKEYGEPNNQNDTLIEYTWGSISFLVMFDNKSQKANYVNLLYSADK